MSKKLAVFVKGMREKPATTLPGVGPVTGERLKRKGIFTADALLAKYKSMRGKFQFEEWFINNTGANSKQASDCCRALDKWSKRGRSAAPYSRDDRVSKTYNRRTVTVTEETYHCSSSHQQREEYYDSTDFSESEDEYYENHRNYRKY